MTKAIEIFSILAGELGMRIEDVTEIARRVREAGYFVKETRSPQSPRATPRHCANLIAAIMSDEPARHAARGVANAELAVTDYGDIKHTRMFNLDGHLKTFQIEDHSFIDGIEALIKCSIDDPVYFEERFEETIISYETIKGIGNIELHENDLENPGNYKIDVMIEYVNQQKCSMNRGELLKETQIRVRTIGALGRLIARGENV